MLTEVRKKPEIQRRLRLEILDSCIGVRLPTYDDLTPEKMPYLNAVSFEILRLAKTANLTFREAQKDVVVDGIV